LWRRASQAAWKAGNWSSTDAGEQLSVLKGRGPIVICNDALPWRSQRTEQLWQLNWIAEVAPASPDSLQVEWEKQLDLVLSGMRRLWFTVGMLARGYAGFYFTSHRSLFASGDYSEHAIDTVLVPWLERYVAWLPELLMLQDRFVRADRHVGLSSLHGSAWFSIGLLIAHHCGLVSEGQFQSLSATPSESLVDALMDDGVIRRVGDRFCVRWPNVSHRGD
jgi:hypothetical protein